VTLEWTDPRTDERGPRSKCGRYAVCSIGDGKEERWQAWKLAPGGPWFALLAIDILSETEAREICEQDAHRPDARPSPFTATGEPK
jgi:hypothetical protein